LFLQVGFAAHSGGETGQHLLGVVLATDASVMSANVGIVPHIV